MSTHVRKLSLVSRYYIGSLIGSIPKRRLSSSSKRQIVTPVDVLEVVVKSLLQLTAL